MTLRDFYREHGFNSKPDIRVSQQCYENSSENIQYIRLPKPVDGFNFCIISENGVKKAREDKANLKELEMSYDSEYGWHAQLPDTSEKSDLEFDW
jgi:hypothetical protein